MAETFIVEVPDEVGATLDRIERVTNRDRSSLIGEALAEYASREACIIEGVERGLDDVRAGRVSSHEDAMRRLHETVDRVAAASDATGE